MVDIVEALELFMEADESTRAYVIELLKHQEPISGDQDSHCETAQ